MWGYFRTRRAVVEMTDQYRCLAEDCDETFRLKSRAHDHARQHYPAVGNYGMYDFIEIIPTYERSTDVESSLEGRLPSDS